MTAASPISAPASAARNNLRAHILEEIKRLANANGRQPPGRGRFARETGISDGKWSGVFWARWGDALIEAGFAPNPLNQRLDENEPLRKIAESVPHFGRFPSPLDFRIYKKEHDSSFPSYGAIRNHFKSQKVLREALAEWCGRHSEFGDVAAALPSGDRGGSDSLHYSSTGFVYLLRSGFHYKIGRSDSLERRVKEVRIAMPESLTLVHAIRTDDPPGIEAYWHRRFADRRANGEWFKLDRSDIAAFKKRKFQ